MVARVEMHSGASEFVRRLGLDVFFLDEAVGFRFVDADVVAGAVHRQALAAVEVAIAAQRLFAVAAHAGHELDIGDLFAVLRVGQGPVLRGGSKMRSLE